jgi:restriction endonuclease Mrr
VHELSLARIAGKQCHDDCSLNGVLIVGTDLVKHMIDANLGVSVSRAYEVKRIDTDYFGEG